MSEVLELCRRVDSLLDAMERQWRPVGSPNWATKGFRAPGVRSAPAGDPRNRTHVGEWTAGPEWCDREDPVLSVSIAVSLADVSQGQSIDAFSASANLDFSDAFLEISFGNDNHGPESIVDVDLIAGTAIEIVGRRANFNVVYPTTTANGATSPLLDVSVSLGIGSSGGVGNVPRKTVKVGALQQNVESLKVAIPPFAHLMSLQTTDNLAQAVLLQYGSGNSAVLAQSTLQKAQGVEVPVANGARFVTLTAGSVATGAAVVFFLNAA